MFFHEDFFTKIHKENLPFHSRELFRSVSPSAVEHRMSAWEIFRKGKTCAFTLRKKLSKKALRKTQFSLEEKEREWERN